MKIYALRDRLIDYFMQPFVGPDDKNVLAAVARTVNQENLSSDIAQAPHHFEVWELGEVTEDGHIVPERRLIADCSSLIRRDIRRGAQPEGDKATNPAGEDPTADRGNGSPGRAHRGAIPHETPPTATPTGKIRREPAGGHQPREGLDA